MDTGITIVIVAGGDATRLPGKLSLDAGGVPLLERVYRNVAGARPTIVAARDLAPELAAALAVPVVGERGPKRGPLGGLLAALETVRTDWAFAVAGDAPYVDAAFVDRLAALRATGDEAVVPRHADGLVEPLAALYARDPFLRAGAAVLAGSGALHAVAARLRTRYVSVEDPRIFTNVNTPEDYQALRASLGDVDEG
jgi:molybdopterin-guanine dinucleotide biosynthesis protein A